MIAASDPQEFVPRGRQQIARHPGPLEPPLRKDKNFDEFIQNGLEKVSLSENKLSEFWILRRAPDNEINKCINKTESKSEHKSYTSLASVSYVMDYTDLVDDSNSFKTSDTSFHQKVINKRVSDTSTRTSNKRFQSGEKQHATNITDNSLKSKISPGFMEDELYVKGHTAVWSRGLLNSDNREDNGRTIISSYTVPLPIKQALWVVFYCERPIFESNNIDIQENKEYAGTPTPAICLVDKNNIRVFVVKGEQFVIPMPFRIEKIWNTKYGIIIEKSLDGQNEEKYGQDYTAPIFSLAYPLDDVCQVVTNRNNTITRFMNSNCKIVFTSNNPSICMIFDTVTKEHVVYKIRKVRQDEKDYGENVTGSHSAVYNSQKLKSRLSMWDNLMTSGSLVTPSPINKKPTPHEKHPVAHQKTKSFCSMATMSRCQSPAVVESPWLGPASNKAYLEKDYSHPKSFFNCSKYMSHLKSTPNICFEYIWSDAYSFKDNFTAGPATSVFLSKDFIGQWYLCYILPSRFQLSVVKVDFTDTNISFGLVTSISAKDAINIPHLDMLAILEHTGNVTLYSGLTVVGKLHIGGTLLQHTPSPCIRRHMRSPFPRRSSLLPLSKQPEPIFDEHLLSPVLPSAAQPNLNFLPPAGNPTPLKYSFQGVEKKATLVGLSDEVENRITLKYSDGTFYRVTVPILTHSELVEHCLVALRQCLPRDAALVVVCRWYATRNAIGNTDLDTKQEWEMFSGLLLELLGYEEDHIFEKPETPASAVKKPKTTPSCSDDDWLFLSKSDHKDITDSLSHILKLPLGITNDSSVDNEVPKITINPKSVLFPYIRYIHFSLHLLYEDFKLNLLFNDILLPLAKFLSKICNDLGLVDFVTHYWKDFPKMVVFTKPVIDENVGKSINMWQGLSDKPISVMSYICHLLQKRSLSPYPYFANVNSRSRDIVQLCGLLSELNHSCDADISKDCFTQNQAGVQQENVNEKSVLVDDKAIEQVVLTMVDMNITKRYLETLPIGISFLLYTALWKCRENPPSDWPVDAYRLLWRDDLVSQAQEIEMEKNKLSDEKVNTVFQLQESMPNTKQEIADLDGMEDIDCSLTKMRFSDDIRVLEARKMLASSKPVPITLIQRPDVSDHDFIEEQEKHLFGICIRTMALPVGRGMITLRTTTPIITEPLATPTLCLTGKALPRGNTVELNHIDTPANMNLWPLFHNGVANGLRITTGAENIDCTWIIFNKPKGCAEPQMEHAGFLMALGLNGHLSNLAVLNKFVYFSKQHEMTSVGILLGLAAAFRGTRNQSLTKILAIHVEALLPPTSMEFDVSQNIQVAGLLGIGLVYQGSAHRHITEVLLSEIGRPPGPEMENSVDRESYSLAAGLALGLVMLKHGDQPAGMSDLNVPDTLHYYMVGGNKRPLTGSQKDKYKTPSFQIREGSSVNLDVTAPGATLALAMMYMGTGNKAVADWMSLPETQYLLDFVRPDFLMLRSLSKSLILWKDIDPSKDWVESLVPSSIRPYCLVTPTSLDIDYEAMNQAYCNIVAGACFALGLKYAGSADKEAFDTLLFFCHMFTSLTGKSIAELAGKATIETCLNVLLLSASMVMAGTGNLEIMRLVRHLRRRLGASINGIVTYGSQLAIHMALGLLFLGGGRYTLSNSPSSIAALICAFYPKFPIHSNDNKYHLQAFRHLYVLAVEPRLLIPKDVFTDEICYARLRIVKLDGVQMEIKGPGLIPDPNSLAKVILDDERYWPVVFERGRNWELLLKILSTTGYIAVKQRAGCLSYVTDKFGHHSDLARTLTQSKVIPWDPPSNSVISFTSDESVRNFCESVLNIDRTKASYMEKKMVQLLTRMTYDAVVKDRVIIIDIMIALLKMIVMLNSEYHTLGLWQLKIISQQVFSKSPLPNLIPKETILALNQEVSDIFDKHLETLKQDLRNFSISSGFNAQKNLLAEYIVFHDIPNDLAENTLQNSFFQSLIEMKNRTGSCSEHEKVLEFWK
ncbi:anaphase-promoting complex subunit 1 [Sitophilus oryzae]|uniref:Anaphase-promoting complex subunit 1 n=1 Tax=Sitophilus oryzae TaxID=7048 RepID=A0A6J2XVQ1_SITOR|nr:anaphase-promoting complex subunit 1 [Sitophilus oryzae]